MAKKSLIFSGLAALILIIGGWMVMNKPDAPSLEPQPDPISPVIWHSIDVSGKDSSGDAHLFLLPDGTSILLDTGYERFAESSLIPYLKSLDLESLDIVIISHAHKNHYGSLMALANHFQIKALKVTPPDADVCATESYRDRCSVMHLEQFLSALPDTTVAPFVTGESVYSNDQDKVNLTVVHQSNTMQGSMYAPHRESGAKFTINESSAVLRLEYGNMSVLLPGDIGPITGDVLIDHYANEIESTLLAAPHHGVTPLPNKKFFELVSPEAIVVSVSMPPFVGDRGELLREVADEYQIPLYITGRSGSIVTTLLPDSFQIKTEK